MRRRVWLLALAASLGAPASRVLAHESTAVQSGLRPAGQGLLRLWGFAVYRARLWVAPGFRPPRYDETSLMLELEYLRDFSGEAIARRSLEEMRRIGRFDDEQGRRWQQALQSVLPDVSPGDRLSGLHLPGRGARFLHRDGRLLGEIADAEFSRLFFGIWLSERSSAPDLRTQLLGSFAAQDIPVAARLSSASPAPAWGKTPSRERS